MSAPVNQTAPLPVDDRAARLGFWLRNDASRLLLPTRCLVCRAPGGEALDLCPACEAALPWNRIACPGCALPLPVPAATRCRVCRSGAAPLAAVHAAFVYAAPVDGLLRRFKFHADLAAGALLAQLMAGTGAGWPRPQALLPVPLHTARLRRRGYDQARELAAPLARALGLPLLDRALVRVRATGAQSERDAAERRRNLLGAFAVRPDAVLPAHVALVDDVMTTGATLHAAADALTRAGVTRVEAWVCARVP